MLDYDPKTSVRHWPMPMARFGQNLFGENLYRIVFASSRRSLVFGEWPDGSRQAKYLTKYPAIGDAWILERWQSAEQFAHCDRAAWDLNYTVLGPYPERGEYEICAPPLACSPDDAAIEKLISWVEESQKRSFFENRTAIARDQEYEKTSIDNTKDAMIRNCLPAFGVAPMSGYGGGRGTKADTLVVSANDMRMPIKRNKLPNLKGIHSPMTGKEQHGRAA